MALSKLQPLLEDMLGREEFMIRMQKTKRAQVNKRRRFSRSIVAAVDVSKILGINAGSRSDHRFIGIWAVVVDGRVFARSWTLEPGGWYRTFLEDPIGTMQVGERQVRIRAVPARAKRIRDAVERAYAEKYSTPASRKYVRGFRTPRRRDTTVEFVPR